MVLLLVKKNINNLGLKLFWLATKKGYVELFSVTKEVKVIREQELNFPYYRESLHDCLRIACPGLVAAGETTIQVWGENGLAEKASKSFKPNPVTFPSILQGTCNNGYSTNIHITKPYGNIIQFNMGIIICKDCYGLYQTFLL